MKTCTDLNEDVSNQINLDLHVVSAKYSYQRGTLVMHYLFPSLRALQCGSAGEHIIQTNKITQLIVELEI